MQPSRPRFWFLTGGPVAVVVLTCSIWVRSLWVQDSVCHIGPTGRVICLHTHPGGISVDWSDGDWNTTSGTFYFINPSSGDLRPGRRSGSGWHFERAVYRATHALLAKPTVIQVHTQGKPEQNYPFPAGMDIELPAPKWSVPDHHLLGFGVDRHRPRPTPWAVAEGLNYVVSSVHMPFAAIVLLALIVAGGPAWARLRSHRRRANNRCPCCGYDLRGSPGRCPECGTAVDLARARRPAGSGTM